MNNRAIKHSLALLKIEAVLTSMVFAMPILNVFYAKEIGLSLAEVGLAQAAFTAAVFTLNVPTGWLADRFSRKACNVAGDTIAALAFVYYAFAQTLGDIIVAEIAIGIGLAFTNGADTGLLLAYAKKLGVSYTRINAQIASWRPLAEMGAVTLGGLIGAQNPRLAIALSGVSYGVGALLSLAITEVGERRITQRHPLHDMAVITHYTLRGNKQLAWRVAAYAFGRESTHPLVWILTPLMLMAGVPMQVIGLGWAINLALVWVGAHTARRYGAPLQDWQQIAVGLIIFSVAAATLSVNVSLATIGLYAAFGFVRGWFSATLMPMLQQHAPADIQSTVTSVAGSAAQLLYIPLVIGFGALGDIAPNMSVAGALVVFTPLLALAAYKIRSLAQ